MSIHRSAVVPRSESQTRVRYASSNVLEIEFHGYVTGADVEAAIEGVRSHLKVGRPKVFLIETTRSVGYSPGVRLPGGELLRTLKEAGATVGFCVAPSSAVRMIGAALAFVTSVPVTFVSTSEEAFAEIHRDQRGNIRSQSSESR